MKSNIFLTYALVAGLLCVLFIPFVIADTQLFPFITGKGFTFRILVEILFGLWFVGMFFDSSLRPKTSWLSWSVLVLTGVVFLADIFGHSFYHSFWSNYERMDGFLTTLHVAGYYFVASSVLTTKARWRLFFNTSVVASVMMSFYTFMQLAGKIQINQGGVRIDGTFGNATYLAVYMLLNIFITLLLSLGVYERGVKNNWPLYSWYGLALICQLISLYYTATRGAILALFGGLFLTAIGIVLFEKNRPMIRRAGVGLLVLVIVVVGGFFAVRKTNFVNNSQTLSRFSSITVESVNNQGRRFVWPMAWEGFKERPILGWGQENFNYVFNKYYDPRMYNQEPWFDRAHNVVLDWLVTTGLVGFVTYLSLFAGALYLIWKNKDFSLGQKSLLVGLLAAYFFQNLFVFDNLISYVYFFSLLAYIHSEFVQNKNSPAWIEKLSQNKAISQAVIPTVVAIGVIVMIYSWNIRPIGASRDLIRALSFNKNTAEESLGYFKQVFDSDTFATGEATDQMLGQFNAFVNSNVSPQTSQKFVELLFENLEKTINRFPDDARYLLSMGSTRVRAGDIEGAMPYLKRALEVTPRKQRVYFEIGLAQLSAGNYDAALGQFKTAYELDTTSPESKILYAIAALYAKQNVLADSLISDLSKNPEFFDERLVSAYANTGNPAGAVKILENRVKLLPDDASVRLRLAAGYLAIGQKAKSISVLQAMLTEFPDKKTEIEYFIKEIQAGRDPTKTK